MTSAESMPQTAPFLEAFRRFEAGLNGEAAGDIHRLRREAIDRFSALGFPTTHHEEWRFTNVLPFVRREWQAAPAPRPVSPEELRGIALPGAIQLLLVNGSFVPDSSAGGLPPGVTAGSLRRAAAADDPDIARLLDREEAPADAFAALNTAFLLDGAFVRIGDGIRLDRPIQIIHLAAGSSFIAHPRTLIVAGRRSAAHIVETFTAAGPGEYFTNAVGDVIVGEEARVEHTKFQMESGSAAHIGSTRFSLGRSSALVSHAISIGAALARNTLSVLLDGEEIDATLYGLAISGGDQLADNHTVIDHRKPRCKSVEVYRGILDGSARGVFNGKIIVRPDAQGTDARQSNKNLLLSESATIDTKPQLEIFANDVKCAHGATVGQLDEEQLFYLRTRGIAADRARSILTRGFAADLINRIEIPELRERLEGILSDKLESPNNS